MKPNAKTKRALERKDNEISELKDMLSHVARFLRAGDDDGTFCDWLARAELNLMGRDRPWHLGLAEEIEEMLQPGQQYAPFEPEGKRK